MRYPMRERGVRNELCGGIWFFERPSGIFWELGVTAPAILRGGWSGIYGRFIWHVKAKKGYIGLT